MAGRWRRGAPRRGPAQGSPPVAGTITAIEPQTRTRSERVNIRIDGAYAFSLSVDRAAGLRVGDLLDTADVATLLEQDTTERAYHRALHFLAARPRSAFEVRRRLLSGGIDEQPALQIIERLQRQGLIDDAEFAAYWVDQRQTHRPRGPRALRAELRAKGVAGETMHPAIQSAADTQSDAAVRAGLREARRRRAQDEREFMASLGKFLARRGFDYGIVRAATAHLWREVQSEAFTRP